jgi:hypothetical protein
VLVIGSLIYSASHAWFWQRAHDMAWVSAPLLLILVGLLLRRSRIAWWVFVSFGGIGLVTGILQDVGQPVSAEWVVGGLLGLIEFGLLVSPPMRRFVRFQGWLAASPS